MPPGVIVCVVIFHLLCGGICLHLAKQKGRSGLWFFAGLLFGILAILLVSIASDLNREDLVEGKIDGIRDMLNQAAFRQATKLGSGNDQLLCKTCESFRHRYSVCQAFSRIVTETVVECAIYKAAGQPPESPPLT